ncbi:hypothetical protein ALT1000_10230 [Alteromonas macleodii]
MSESFHCIPSYPVVLGTLDGTLIPKSIQWCTQNGTNYQTPH